MTVRSEEAESRTSDVVSAGQGVARALLSVLRHVEPMGGTRAA